MYSDPGDSAMRLASAVALIFFSCVPGFGAAIPAPVCGEQVSCVPTISFSVQGIELSSFLRIASPDGKAFSITADLAEINEVLAGIAEISLFEVTSDSDPFITYAFSYVAVPLPPLEVFVDFQQP